MFTQAFCHLKLFWSHFWCGLFTWAMFSVVFLSSQHPTERCIGWHFSGISGDNGEFGQALECFLGLCLVIQAWWPHAVMARWQQLWLLPCAVPTTPTPVPHMWRCLHAAEVVRSGEKTTCDVCHMPCHHLSTSHTLPIWSNGFFRKPLN